jgi:hypothetical protein
MTKDPSDWTAVSISRKRLNGLKLRTTQQNRRNPGNTLDTILRDSGIPELTDKELEVALKKLEVPAE